MKTGCVVDVSDDRDVLWTPDMHGSAIVTAESFDLRGYLPPVRSQKKQNCCGHAMKSQLVGNAKGDGGSIAEPSVDFLYAIAQITARPKAPLLDNGSSLRFMCKAMARRNAQGEAGLGEGFGVATEDAWPEREEHAIPPDDVWRYAEACTIGGYSFLPDGASSADRIVMALRRLRFPTLCMIVDEKFTQSTDEVYHIPGGMMIGSHCMIACGYNKGLGAILVQNSWGEDFGDRGYVWLSTGFVNRSTYGKVVVEVTPGRAVA